MTKRIQAHCDQCKKELGDYGWLNVVIGETGPYGEYYENTKQFCDNKCLADWAYGK